MLNVLWNYLASPFKGFKWSTTSDEDVTEGYIHMDPLQDPAANFHIITSQHYDNPNISPGFVWQENYKIWDKNNPSHMDQSTE